LAVKVGAFLLQLTPKVVKDKFSRRVSTYAKDKGVKLVVQAEE
jgi:hypothetical protein